MICRNFIISILIQLLFAHAYAEDCTTLFIKSGLSVYSFHNRQYDRLQKEVDTYYQKLDPEYLFFLSKKLTSYYGQSEMSFQVKNPATGRYDRFVSVPVNARAVLIENNKFQDIVQSTEPILKVLRRLLQYVYSGKNLDAANSFLNRIPKSERELLIQIIKGSIYLEPQLIHPSMRDYPFLSVAGFDGALGDPDKPIPHFFEMNLGTPSGLSNNALLTKSLFDLDLRLKTLVEDNIGQDQTFYLLRRAIESNAFQWTGLATGISVVISPGVYNGAHPDVAAIAKLSGMPLVKSSDLYEDQFGSIRLNTGKGKEHPIVTGIYGRMEESFFLQSNSDQIPMISPSYMQNEELGRRLGVKLKNGVIYDFVYDDLGQIKDVQRDSTGKPLFQTIWDTIGQDPNRPDAKSGSFLKAIQNRKLYYSALGGRVVDDKRLFPLIAKHLIRAKKSAQPVSSVPRSELYKVFENPNRYVVKEPANSGGVGIYFLGKMNDSDNELVLKKLKANPEAYEVQELAAPTTVLDLIRDPNGQIRQVPVVTDLRIFVFLDGDGRVSAGQNSILLRTAPFGELYSNTSRGGGYGVGIIYNKQRSSATQPQLQNNAVSTVATAGSRAAQLKIFLNQYEKLIYQLKFEAQRADFKIDQLQIDLRSFSFKIRDLLDVLPNELQDMASRSRELADMNSSELTAEKLNRYFDFLMLRLSHLYDAQLFTSGSMAQATQEFLSANEEKWILDLNYWPPDRARLGSLVQLEKLPTPEIAYQRREAKHVPWERVELAKYKKVNNAFIEAARIELEAAGGELRYLRKIIYVKSKVSESKYEPAYFWVNHSLENLTSYLKPVIAIDLTAPGALASLAHEMAHFRQWKRLKAQLMSQGLTDREASIQAAESMGSEEGTLEAEREALQDEIRTENNFRGDLFNVSRDLPKNESEFGFVNRWLYPEFEAVRRILLAGKNTTASQEERSRQLMYEMISYASRLKLKALENARALDFDKWNKSSLIELIMLPFGIERLEADKTFDAFVRLYIETLKKQHMQIDFNPEAFHKFFEERDINLQQSEDDQQ